MTVFTWTDEEFALWIAQRDSRAAQQIALWQGIRLEDFQPRSSQIRTPV